jgi:glyoxylase-like metal-dependent hydrolase (beta-lactamase superfamily II)
MSKIKALINPVTPFQQNAPIIFCEETKKCAFVDPGGDLEVLLASAANNDLIPEKILLTHGHIDHAAGATELANTLSLEIIGPHIDDKFLLDELEAQGSMDCLLKIAHQTYG